MTSDVIRANPVIVISSPFFFLSRLEDGPHSMYSPVTTDAAIPPNHTTFLSSIVIVFVADSATNPY